MNDGCVEVMMEIRNDGHDWVWWWWNSEEEEEGDGDRENGLAGLACLDGRRLWAASRRKIYFPTGRIIFTRDVLIWNGNGKFKPRVEKSILFCPDLKPGQHLNPILKFSLSWTWTSQRPLHFFVSNYLWPRMGKADNMTAKWKRFPHKTSKMTQLPLIDNSLYPTLSSFH